MPPAYSGPKDTQVQGERGDDLLFQVKALKASEKNSAEIRANLLQDRHRLLGLWKPNANDVMHTNPQVPCHQAAAGRSHPAVGKAQSACRGDAKRSPQMALHSKETRTLCESKRKRRETHECGVSVAQTWGATARHVLCAGVQGEAQAPRGSLLSSRQRGGGPCPSFFGLGQNSVPCRAGRRPHSRSLSETPLSGRPPVSVTRFAAPPHPLR